MALDKNINTLEKDKFCETGGLTAVRTCATIEGEVEVNPSDAPSEDPTTGDTVHAVGSVGLVFINIPAVSGGVISSFLIEVKDDQVSTNELHVSLDGGANFKTLTTGANWIWVPRGGLTQIKIKGNAASVSYDIVLNRNA